MIVLMARDLNLLMLGDDEARSMEFEWAWPVQCSWRLQHWQQALLWR